MTFNKYMNKKKRSFDEEYMRVALKAAEDAKSRGDAARGAVLAFPNGHIVEGHTVLSEHSPLAHAEMNVLKKACETMNKSFKDTVLYCTVEPCAMCAIAAYEHGVREIIFGAFDDHNGFISSPRSIIPENFNLTYRGGLLSEECYLIATPTLRENLRFITKDQYEAPPARDSGSN